MEFEETYLLSLHFAVNEVPALKTLVAKLKNNPQAAGYVKKAFTKDERALIDDLFEILCDEEKQEISMTAHGSQQYTPEDE